MSEIAAGIAKRQDQDLMQDIKRLARKVSNRCHALDLLTKLWNAGSTDVRLLEIDRLEEEYKDLATDLGALLATYDKRVTEHNLLRDAQIESIKQTYKEQAAPRLGDRSASKIKIYR